MARDVSAVDDRRFLAGFLSGGTGRWRFEPPLAAAQWLECALGDDVVALVERRMRDGSAAVPESVRELFTDAARAEVAQFMVRQAEARRVLARLAEAGLPVLLLKGSALAYWAYPEPHLRHCVDVDLLFASRADAVAAADLLAPDGYVVRQHFGDAASREFLCVRQRPGSPRVEFDMHWGLSGKPVFADRLAFEELMAGSMPLPALAPPARGLGPVHACLHACMHRMADLSNGGGDRLKWLYDLHLLALSLDGAGWEGLRALAVDRGLAGVCVDGLTEAAAMFGTPLPDATLTALRSAGESEPLDPKRLRNWTYFQRQNLRALPDWRARLRWIWQRLRPTLDYREDVGVASGGLVRDRIRRALRQLRR
jgi:hypothetical protein